MISIKKYNISDPKPGILLEDITQLSVRAHKMLAQNQDENFMHRNADRFFGVIQMIGGLEYHYKAFLRLIEQQKIGNFSAEDDVIHEIVAYLNRLGQFYYFAKSDFVCGILKSTPDMVEIKKILPLRMKNTAHRSYDDPRREDTPELMALQSFGMLSLQNFIPRDSNNPYELGVDDKASKWRKTFQGVQIPLHDGEVCEFFLETDHPKIIQEAFDIFSQVLNKGLEST